MSNVFTIMRRELSAYFKSPIGYIFMIVFIAISVGLYATTFFTFPVADMRGYFGNLPILLCVFMPAVTMRVWAEERKENTWELLLTFPMKAWELVIGKFLASLCFFALTLVATFTVPVMLMQLGEPDMGAITSGYIGTFLMGAFFLAIGIFFSGFYKDQIIAFVVTLLVCFGIFLIGTQFAAFLDGMRPGLGSLLSELVGVNTHYGAFTRGVIEVADILYFVAWTAVFLALNIVYIDERNRKGGRLNFALTVAAVVGIGFLGNWLISDTSLGRFDVTEEKIFTVSDASKRILSDVDTTVQIKYYVTPKADMPTGMTTIEQDVTDKLDELRVASGGKIQYQVVNLQVSNVIADPKANIGQEEEGEEEDKETLLEERMLEKGVQPYSVQVMSDDQMTNKLLYSTIGIGYKDKPEEILPQIMPQVLPELEYRLVSTIYKLTQEKKPIVAFVAPTEAISIDPQMRRMLEQMGQPVPESDDPYKILEQLLLYEKYEVKRVELSADSPMPEEYDTLVIINPRQFNERHRWEIGRALHAGKSVVIAAQTYEWDYVPQGRGVQLNTRNENPGLNDVLAAYGLWISEDVLMDVTHTPLQVGGGNQLQSLLGGGIQLDLETHIMVSNDNMDSETSITSQLSTIFYLWGSALEINEAAMKENGLEPQVLMSTTPEAWQIPNPTEVTQATFAAPASGREQFPLAVLVTGQFPDAFEGQERPAWPIDPPQPGQPPQPPPPVEEPAAAITPAPGKMILIGGSEMFRENFLRSSPGHMDLFLNSVDAVTLGDDLVSVRGKKPRARTFDRPDSATRRFWKAINYGFSTSIIAGIGVVSFVLRRRSRNAYTLAFSKDD